MIMKGVGMCVAGMPLDIMAQTLCHVVWQVRACEIL